jgi:hypothetical protein
MTDHKRLMADLPNSRRNVVWERVFAGAFGLWLALALIKIGVPIILSDKTPAPTNFMEVLLAGWPVEWGYFIFIPVVALGLVVARWSLPAPRWLVLLPAAWFGWVLLSALGTVDATLTRSTVAHFGICVLTFYLGVFALGRVAELRWFWAALLGGFCLVLLVGWYQHFIGLEETREFFYRQPNWREYPPEFLRKISSDRIYATLFYPNALAGVILLLTPLTLWALWKPTAQIPPVGRWVLLGAAFVLPAGCLVWSGSKAGWLILVAVATTGLWRAAVSKRTKTVVTLLAVTLALGGFAARHAGYFAKGATSVTARGDYWRAAVQLTMERPVIGSGPGTFRLGYKRLKAPEAEMTRLVHNDYLQQAADSGIPAFLLFTTFVVGSLWWIHRTLLPSGWSLAFAVWLGVAAYAAQSALEFGLYIPALAWPFFALTGWLWGRGLVTKD